MLIQTTRIIGIFCAGKGCFQALLFFFLCCFFVAAPSVAAPGNFALDFTTIRLGDDTPELAQAHGVRAAYPSFGIEYIQNVLQTNINSAFLALA